MNPFAPIRSGLLAAALLGAAVGGALAADPACHAASGARRADVVELYTSEGCSSCPPADHWLSGLKGRDDVVALAFHVDYWDNLGWKDRFASPAYTARQAEWRARLKARFVYTPQVIVDGADTRDLPAAAAPRVDLALDREGDAVRARVTPRPGAPARLAAYWAVTENGHATAVKAGENGGATLHHDFVVREYVPVAAWSSAPGVAATLALRPTTRPDPGHPRRIDLVVFDPETGRPLQALALACD